MSVFSIIDQSLPTPAGNSRLPPEKATYFVGWVVALWLVPGILLPSPGATSVRRIRSWVRLIAITAVMAVVCWLAGSGLVQVGVTIHDLFDYGESKGANSGDPRKFWLISPSALNPICGALFVVALSPVWWGALWPIHRRWAARIWIASFALFSVVYAGIGGLSYANRGWALHIDKNWEFFLAFASFPAMMIMIVLALLVMTDTHKPAPNGLGWPVTAFFGGYCRPV